MEDWIEAEFRNWSRWCNFGGTILPWGISAAVLFDENTVPQPINEDRARRVQQVYDDAAKVERKVLQAEYISPYQYRRTVSVAAAARKLEISVPSYEMLLSDMKRRVEKVFR